MDLEESYLFRRTFKQIRVGIIVGELETFVYKGFSALFSFFNKIMTLYFFSNISYSLDSLTFGDVRERHGTRLD